VIDDELLRAFEAGQPADPPSRHQTISEWGGRTSTRRSVAPDLRPLP
jgi:hypothetical protein